MSVVETRTLPKWILHGCERCRGDLFRNNHSYQCLQCGYIVWDVKKSAPLPKISVTPPHKQHSEGSHE